MNVHVGGDFVLDLLLDSCLHGGGGGIYRISCSIYRISSRTMGFITGIQVILHDFEFNEKVCGLNLVYGS